MLPLRTRLDLVEMAINEYSAFPKAHVFTGTSSIRLLCVISGHSLGKSYPSAEIHSVYSAASADWGKTYNVSITLLYEQAWEQTEQCFRQDSARVKAARSTDALKNFQKFQMRKFIICNDGL